VKTNSILRVKVLSQATSVPGQGVGAAYQEQIHLIQSSKKLNTLLNRRGQYDVIHLHTINFRYFLAMLLTNKPTIVYVHFLPTTLNGSIKLPKLFFGIFKWYVKIFYRKADYLVVVNPIFIDPLVRLGIPKNRISFIPNYVNQVNFKSTKPLKTLRKHFQFNKFTVLGVGQVQHRKGILDFIEVAKRLPQLDFVWAGGFSFKGLTSGYQELKALMDNPPKNVRFLGIIPREDMKDLYAACDVFFLPSLDELMPMSVLEATVNDKPILLRDLPLYQPVFFGHYLAAHDVDGFAKILLDLSQDLNQQQLAVALTQKLKNAYQQEVILKQWEDYYQEVVHHGKTH
jgi:1,2-diacylglycerol-3-alpha-glucose alpha-1,2-galactosyltransferase